MDFKLQLGFLQDKVADKSPRLQGYRDSKKLSTRFYSHPF